MKQIKVSEATPIQLDWLVSKVENDMAYKNYAGQRNAEYAGVEFYMLCWEGRVGLDFMRYCADWALAGPIIEREGIDLYCNVPTNPEHKDPSWRGSWRAKYHRCGFGTEIFYGPTALIAACRCFVASKLGDEVEVPKELV